MLNMSRDFDRRAEGRERRDEAMSSRAQRSREIRPTKSRLARDSKPRCPYDFAQSLSNGAKGSFGRNDKEEKCSLGFSPC